MSQKSVQERYNFRKLRTRKKLWGTAERPRLSVFRSSKHIYAQLVDDGKGQTLAAASSLPAEGKAKGGKTGANVEAAKVVGRAIAERAKSLKIEQVVFDRGARPYHGRVKALADGAREAGLRF